MAQKGPFIKNDRFGNPFQVIGCKPNKGGFPVGYVELKGQLYKLEPSEAKGEGDFSMWIRVTAVKKQAKVTSM